ncbi:Transferase [Sesbania bispinosa]|nr:Transferase [Sesbania bispinosa]
MLEWILSQPLVATSFTFGPTHVLGLKKQCEPSLKRITTFEVVVAHTWRSWVRSLNLSSTLVTKLLFAVNIREKMKLPEGYYGNGVALGKRILSSSVLNWMKSDPLKFNLGICIRRSKEDSAGQE